MAKHELEVQEGAEATDQVGIPPLVEKKTFRCINPLFKNGTAYKKGQKIELEVETGQRFVDAGDVEEIE